MPVKLNAVLDDRAISNQEKSFMQNLQANILKGHGREHVALLFFKVRDVPAARAFLRGFPVTDAFTQQQQTKAFRKHRVPGDTVRLAFLSQTGLERFGHGRKFARFAAFAGGMAADTGVLDGGNTNSWQSELKRPIDVALLLADNDESVLARGVTDTLAECAEAYELLFVQAGRAYRNGDGEGVEHFGYVDGRSQPLMIQSAIDAERDSRRGGLDDYDPSAPLSQFLLADPLKARGFGSFFVFRKLEQDVAGFKAREEALANTLGLTGDDEERAGAMVVGRFEDGTPLTLHAQEDGVPVVNNFDFSADADGSRCSFHGHIRKTNPRGSSPGGLAFDKSVQMARRGITYGVRMQHPETREFIDLPNDGVGLLFMSYQASIEKQFQFMQTQWANNPGFPTAGVGIDPVIGQLSGRGAAAPQTWLPAYGALTNPTRVRFSGFVALKGGEYLFAPSINGLKAI